MKNSSTKTLEQRVEDLEKALEEIPRRGRWLRAAEAELPSRWPRVVGCRLASLSRCRRSSRHLLDRQLSEDAICRPLHSREAAR